MGNTGDASAAAAAEQDNNGNQRKLQWRGRRRNGERTRQLEAYTIYFKINLSIFLIEEDVY
jgi:hypothetical protein